MRAVESLWGAILEAWQELRIHRTRVLLSLIGVGVAVCALSSVVGLANIAEQSLRENNERYGGRPALISVYPGDGTVSAERSQAVWAQIVERHGITYTSQVQGGSVRVQFRTGAMEVQTQTVDQPYAAMHRTIVKQGRWFTDADAANLAPSLVVNEDFWNRLGSPSLDAHPTATVLRGEQKVTAVVVGVVRTPDQPDQPSALVLGAGAPALVSSDPEMYGSPTQEAWVPPEVGAEMTRAITAEFERSLGVGAVSVNRSDYQAYQSEDPLLFLKLLVGGIAGLILLLGALGLINIAMVTVRGRIREIGIRRSVGATAARVFFAVMMESVVATSVAGAAGVALAILIVKSPWVEELVGRGMVADPPPFPAEAAILGLVAATAVGAIAGLLPALVAVRVKVIDAIRY
ncbi:ABC transporter permease [Leifsonia sp. NPDC058194]|uniref:ABC transporter permease n=1 Tax=Leifsonia sp. NPDC058194 TaxID=3346374 RepID=UPI0036DB0B06